MPVITEQTVKTAGQELGDLVNLALDNKDNSTQGQEFIREGMEAFFAIMQTGIPKEQRGAYLVHLFAAMGDRVKVSFPLNPLPPAPTPVS